MLICLGENETVPRDPALQEVELPVLSYDGRGECGDYERGTVLPGMVCAGYLEGRKDTCQVGIYCNSQRPELIPTASY